MLPAMNTTETTALGTFEKVEFTFGSFGHQYTTIDGQRYVTWFDLCNPRLKGLSPGATVEFTSQPAPTVLCNSPRFEIQAPCATLLRVVKDGAA